MNALAGPVIALASVVYFPAPEVSAPRVVWVDQDTNAPFRIWCVGEDGNLGAISADKGTSGFVLPSGSWACGGQSDSDDDSVMVWVTVEKSLKGMEDEDN